MARKAVIARRGERAPAGRSLARRVGWVALAGFWVFLVVALASFDSADWPSHTVAVHNDPSRNLCGPAGALVAYWDYHVLGLGSWVFLAGIGCFLGAGAANRHIGQVPLRLIGLVLVGLAVSGFHGLLAPQWGPLAGSEPGLIALVVVGELGRRFGDVGTFLVLLAGLGVGAVVAFDRLVAGLLGLLEQQDGDGGAVRGELPRMDRSIRLLLVGDPLQRAVQVRGRSAARRAQNAQGRQPGDSQVRGLPGRERPLAVHRPGFEVGHPL